MQGFEVLKFTEWLEQWQWLVLSGRDGQQHVEYQKTNGNTLSEVKCKFSFSRIHNFKDY